MATIAYSDYEKSPEYHECIRVVEEFENTGSVPETSLKKKEMKTFINFVQATVDDNKRMLGNQPEDLDLAFELKEWEDCLDEATRCFEEMFVTSAT